MHPDEALSEAASRVLREATGLQRSVFQVIGIDQLSGPELTLIGDGGETDATLSRRVTEFNGATLKWVPLYALGETVSPDTEYAVREAIAILQHGFRVPPALPVRRPKPQNFPTEQRSSGERERA